MLTTFHLVRHAAHDLIGRVLAGREIDVSLNAAGEREARMIALRLKAARPAQVLSSPRRRAVETAAPIAAALRLDVGVAPELDEHDCGEWAGRTFDQLQFDPLWRRWNEQRGTVRPPAGESMAELQARVVGYLLALRDRHRGESLVLVSHAEPIRAALLYAQGIPFDDFSRVEVPVGSITTVKVAGRRALADAMLSDSTQGAA